MLANKVILYDDSCPMCRLYTWWFVAWGFLGAENRLRFSQAPPEVTSNIDLDRARHEIPLFDQSTAQTVYGLDALTLILASRWRWLKPITRSVLFRCVFHPMYQIITYNRRVISGCAACNGFDCAPDLNRFYRSVYLMLSCGLIGTTLLSMILVASAPTSTAAIIIVTFLVLGLISCVAVRLSHGTVSGWDCAGNSMTVALMVAATLSPILFWTAMPTVVAISSHAVAILLGLSEYRRRRIAVIHSCSQVSASG